MKQVLRFFCFWALVVFLLAGLPAYAEETLDGADQGGSTGNATQIQSKDIDAPEAGDDGKYIVYDHGNSKFDYDTPAGGGDMQQSVWDGDTDGFIDADAGGTDINTSSSTGVPQIASGTWSIVAQLTHEFGGLEADVSSYDGLVKISGGSTSALTVTSFAESILDDADEATFKATVNLEAGTDFYSVSGADATFQPIDADLTTYAGITPSANVQALMGAADYAAMRGLLDLEAGTDFYSKTAEDTWRASVTQTEMGYLHGVSSDIQTQISAKLDPDGDGSSLTGVIAASGDSATAFFSTGTIEEARIHADIARDSELHAAVTIGTANGLSLSTQQLSLAAATSGTPGAMTAAQVTALEAIDTEAELEALLELQDLQGAVTDSQVPDDITITKVDAITFEITGISDGQILAYDGTTDNRVEAVSLSGAVTMTYAGAVSMATGAAIGDTAFTDLTAGDSYTNFGSADDDTIDELIAAIDTAWPSASGAPTDAHYLTDQAEAGLSAEVVVSANGKSLVTAADYAAMRTLLDLEAGTDFYSKTAEDTWRSSVTQTEMDYLHGITSDIQTQMNTKLATDGDGSSLTGVIAASGDSATSFFSTGTIEDARIASTIARDSEITATKIDDLTAADDNTDLNVSTSAHGLCPKLDNNSAHYLDGTGTWSTPAGGGNVSTSGTPAQYDIARFVDGTDIEGLTYAELAAVSTFESALEGVLDLSDLQGAVTDGQVPNNITIDLATTATTANAGDSATAFFSSGTIEHEYGGLEANVAAYNGLIRITGGATSNITDAAGLGTALGSVDFILATEMDTEGELEGLCGVSLTTDTELAAWAGSANITTLGTIGTGTWQGTAVAKGYVAADLDEDNLAATITFDEGDTIDLSAATVTFGLDTGDLPISGAWNMSSMTVTFGLEDTDIPRVLDDANTDTSGTTYAFKVDRTFQPSGESSQVGVGLAGIVSHYDTDDLTAGYLLGVLGHARTLDAGATGEVAYLRALEGRISAEANTTVTTAMANSAYLSQNAGTITNFVGFQVQDFTGITNMPANTFAFHVPQSTQDPTSAEYSLYSADTEAILYHVGPITGAAAITAGTSFIIGSADVNETELEIIDGATLGTSDLNAIAGINAYSGLVAISGGSPAEVDALSELEGQIADVTHFVVEGTACSDLEGTGLSITTGVLNWSSSGLSWAGNAVAHEYGGLEADVSAYSGLVKITGGATSAVTVTAYAESILDDSDEATFKATVNLEPGTDVQAYDADLAALAGLTTAANKVPYFTGSGTADVADFTAYARTILDDADEATFKATVNLEIGTDVQAYDADLTTYAGITPSANVQTFLGYADFDAMQTGLAIDDLITLSGVSEGAAHLGTFTGTTITDSSTIKTALQELETSLETKLANVVEDTTPQLGGNLDVNAKEIQSSGNVIVQLGDTEAAYKFIIQDSGSNEVWSVDSNGVVSAAAANDPFIYYHEDTADSWWTGIDSTGNSFEWRLAESVGSSVKMELDEDGDLHLAGGLYVAGAGDFGDADITSVDKLEGVDTGVFVDMGTDGILQLAGDGYIHLDVGAETLILEDYVADWVYFGTDTGVVGVAFSEMNMYVGGHIRGDAYIKTAASGVNLVESDRGCIVLATGAGEVGLWDCSADTIGSFVTIWVRDASEQVEVVMYGDTTNDLFRLKDGTETDANDEADLPTTGNQQFCFMCMEANKWYVYSEDGEVTDGGAAD